MSHVSFNPSGGALTALRSANRGLEASQSAIATGREVNDASDNPALYAISEHMRSESGGYAAISSGLNLGKATIATGRSAAQQVVGALGEARSHIIAASAPGADTKSLQAGIEAIAEQVGSLIGSASFGGANLLQGGAGDGYQMLAWAGIGSDGSAGSESITAANQGLLSADGASGALAGLASLDVTTAAGREQALAAIDGMLENAVDAAAALGSAEAHVDGQSEHLSDLAASVNAGLSALVDTNLEEESARLAAESVRQSLATEMQAIANAQSRSVLSLFADSAAK